jgi:hypothetical protein
MLRSVGVDAKLMKATQLREVRYLEDERFVVESQAFDRLDLRITAATVQIESLAFGREATSAPADSTSGRCEVFGQIDEDEKRSDEGQPIANRVRLGQVMERKKVDGEQHQSDRGCQQGYKHLFTSHCSATDLYQGYARSTAGLAGSVRFVTVPAGYGLPVIHPPEDKPWGVREAHARHHDGHVFRLSQSTPHDHEHNGEHPHDAR